jgi:hypothetical protein
MNATAEYNRQVSEKLKEVMADFYPTMIKYGENLERVQQKYF